MRLSKTSVCLELKGVARLIKRNKSFVLTTHSKPDGDGIGSELALHRFLKRIGKRSRIINISQTPWNLQFLAEGDEIEFYKPSKHDKIILNADLIIALDVGCIEKVQDMKDIIFKSAAKTLLIDHHIKRDRHFDYFWVRERAAASGEMVYELIKEINPAVITSKIAEPLFTAIAHDTGNFCYDRTCAKTFFIAADLIARGANQYKIFKAKQCARNIRQLKLASGALENTLLSLSRKVGWCVITNPMLKRYDVDLNNLPRVIDQVLALSDVEVALVFVELARKAIKISVRTKDYVNANNLARQFGGGGHKKSAGFTYSDTLKQTIKKVVTEAETMATKKRRNKK